MESPEFIKIAHTESPGLQKMAPDEAHAAVVKMCAESPSPLTFLLGGEHSMSFGALKALAKKHDPKDVTIFQIDAHCDLRKDDSDYNDTDPTEYAHSAVMRRAHEMGYNLVQVGIRAYSKDEANYFSSFKNIKVFEWNGDKIPTIQKIVSAIKTKKVYISIDVDGIDPALHAIGDLQLLLGQMAIADVAQNADGMASEFLSGSQGGSCSAEWIDDDARFGRLHCT